MSLFRKVLRLTAILAALILFGASTGFAEDLGPAIGTKAPDIGTRLDQSGKPHQLSDLMGRNGLVLSSIAPQTGARFVRLSSST
ncbi:MAG TPA: hypothetical protein VFK01_00400 [Bradyrhizobium sp.]|nr:hypothetical protein [Bradyrhizobium sp.]